MRKVFRFTYQEAITALMDLHPEFFPEPPIFVKDLKDYPVCEIEPRIEEVQQEKQIVHLDGPITTYVETRPTHTDD